MPETTTTAPATTTTAPAAPAAPAAVQSPESITIAEDASRFAAIAAFMGREPAPAEEAPAEEASTDATTAEAEAETETEEPAEEAPASPLTPPAPGKKAKLSDLQRQLAELAKTPAEQWKPEHAASAQKLVRELVKRADKTGAWVEKEMAHLNQQRELVKRELGYREDMIADAKALGSDDIDVVMAALGRLTRKNPTEVVENMVLRTTRDGKPDPTRTELEALKAKEARREQAEAERGVQAQAESLFRQAIADEAEFPHVVAAVRSSKNEAGALAQLMGVFNERRKVGHVVTVRDILTPFELALAKAAQKTQVVPVAVPEAAPAETTTPRAKPGPRPSVGRALNPALAEQASKASREPTKEEHYRAIGALLRQ
jgi:hypothetical protein